MVGVDRQIARQVFTDLPLAGIEELSGESPRVSKVVAMVCFLGAPMLVLIGGVLSLLGVGWWALLVTPVAFLFWVFYKSLSVRGDAGIGPITIVLGVAVFAAIDSGNPTNGLYPAIVLVAAGLWLERFLYWFTTRQVRALVLRSRQAFEELRPGLVLRENSGDY